MPIALAPQELKPEDHLDFWAQYHQRVREAFTLGVNKYACALTGVEVIDGEVAELIRRPFTKLFLGTGNPEVLSEMFTTAEMRLLSACLHFSGSLCDDMPVECYKSILDINLANAINVWGENQPPTRDPSTAITVIVDNHAEIVGSAEAIPNSASLGRSVLSLVSDVAQLHTAGYTTSYLGGVLAQEAVK